ncbi:MAG TPA: hypothetical protein PLT66_07295 [Bacillota bacterium]|nr:hypothetical protein [Bacillota bacterium]
MTGSNDVKKNIITVSDLVAQEQFIAADGTHVPFFSGVSFEAAGGEAFGICATDPKAADALCRIIGNTNPYFSGSCRIGPIGTMQKKRKILPHVFNIDAPDMLIEQASVLENVMLVTLPGSGGVDATDREDAMLDVIIECGLGYLALCQVSSLSGNEKLLVELMISYLSKCMIVVFNVTDVTFSQKEVETVVNIVSMLRKADKCVVISTMQPKVIGMVCDKTLYIHQGVQLFSGTVEELCKNADKVGFVLRASDAEAVAKKLESLVPGWECDVDGQTVYVFNYSGNPTVAADFYRLLSENDICPDMIKSNKGRVENSYTELLRNYALHR